MQEKEIIAAIAAEAQRLWGEDWVACLVRAYCQIESRQSGKAIKPVARRSQIVRSLREGGLTLPSLIRLLQAVGLEIGIKKGGNPPRKID